MSHRLAWRHELIAPGAGAVVMGTGIVSVALATQGYTTLSRILLVLTGLSWAGLALVAGERLVLDRPRFLLEARSPAGLTGVAATAVLGSRLIELGWGAPAAALLVVSLACWPVLTLSAVRHLSDPAHGHPVRLARAPGQVFMITVATEAAGSLTATTALTHHLRWLAYLAVALAVVGICAYPFLLAQFRIRDVIDGPGDQWVAGGSLAISSLAVAQLGRNAVAMGAPAGGATILRTAALALWLAAAAWLVPLVLGELRRPRPRYRSQLWSTVFPLGMYSVSGTAVAALTGVGALEDFAHAWVWVALAGWALAGGGMVARGLALLRSGLIPAGR